VNNSPADYMEQETLRETRFKKVLDRKRMDVMGIALDNAMHDIRELVGMMSDSEEFAEDDEDYGDMNNIVN
jgi:hypothetical protein